LEPRRRVVVLRGSEVDADVVDVVVVVVVVDGDVNDDDEPNRSGHRNRQ
jgi:hypothetical protein